MLVLSLILVTSFFMGFGMTYGDLKNDFFLEDFIASNTRLEELDISKVNQDAALIRKGIKVGDLSILSEERFEAAMYSSIATATPGFIIIIRECFLQGNHELAESLIGEKSKKFQESIFLPDPLISKNEFSGHFWIDFWLEPVFRTLFAQNNMAGLYYFVNNFMKRFRSQEMNSQSEGIILESTLTTTRAHIMLDDQARFASAGQQDLLELDNLILNQMEKMLSASEALDQKVSHLVESLAEMLQRGPNYKLYFYETLLSSITNQTSVEMMLLLVKMEKIRIKKGLNFFFRQVVEGCHFHILERIFLAFEGRSNFNNILQKYYTKSNLMNEITLGVCLDTIEVFKRFSLGDWLEMESNPDLLTVVNDHMRWEKDKKNVMDEYPDVFGPLIRNLCLESPASIIQSPAAMGFLERHDDHGDFCNFNKLTNPLPEEEHIIGGIVDHAFYMLDIDKIVTMWYLNREVTFDAFFHWFFEVDGGSRGESIEVICDFMSQFLIRLGGEISTLTKAEIIFGPAMMDGPMDVEILAASLIGECLSKGSFSSMSQVLHVVEDDDRLVSFLVQSAGSIVNLLNNEPNVLSPGAVLALYKWVLSYKSSRDDLVHKVNISYDTFLSSFAPCLASSTPAFISILDKGLNFQGLQASSILQIAMDCEIPLLSLLVRKRLDFAYALKKAIYAKVDTIDVLFLDYYDRFWLLEPLNLVAENTDEYGGKPCAVIYRIVQGAMIYKASLGSSNQSTNQDYIKTFSTLLRLSTLLLSARKANINTWIKVISANTNDDVVAQVIRHVFDDSGALWTDNEALALASAFEKCSFLVSTGEIQIRRTIEFIQCAIFDLARFIYAREEARRPAIRKNDQSKSHLVSTRKRSASHSYLVGTPALKKYAK